MLALTVQEGLSLFVLAFGGLSLFVLAAVGVRSGVRALPSIGRRSRSC